MPKQSAAKTKRHKTGKKSPDTENLSFVQANSLEDYKKIFEYNIDAFSDTPDFKWTLGDIEHEVQDGWDLYSVNLGKDTIAAVFLKKDKDRLLSKNTAIKMNYQGSGHSHKIKGFIEEKAISLRARYIYHYCRIDNFRMYSLNESHGYKKTNHKFGENGQVVEWMKALKD